MGRSGHNTQLFALREPPPKEVLVGGQAYRLKKVFKHDFFAATALYGAVDSGPSSDRLVVKFGRTQGFCGLPGAWVGRLLLRRERRFHKRADGVEGIQRWAGQLDSTSYALEYVEGQTLDVCGLPPGREGRFFDELRSILDSLHARGAAYCDLHKRSNIVVTPTGRPALIDFQICALDKPHAPWPWRRIVAAAVAYLQRMDLYHLYKHKRRLAPEHLRGEEQSLSRRRTPLLRLHRTLVTPLRRIRRAFLTHRHRAGRLVSPSEHLEDHNQPEKATWRK